MMTKIPAGTERKDDAVKSAVPMVNGKLEIVPLPQAQFQGCAIEFRYVTTVCYRAECRASEDGFALCFVRTALPAPKEKSFTDHLYEPWLEQPAAFGVLQEGRLAACIEMCMETWNNRARVAELWLQADWRRRGVGRALWARGLQWAREQGARALVLETQSCNAPAIAFYRAMGMQLVGCDLAAYTNADAERDEVRMELGMPLTKG